MNGTGFRIIVLVDDGSLATGVFGSGGSSATRSRDASLESSETDLATGSVTESLAAVFAAGSWAGTSGGILRFSR